MKMALITSLGLVALVLVIVFIGPFRPFVDHQKLNCDRYRQTLTALQKAKDDAIAGRLVLPVGKSDVELPEYIDGWGNRLISTTGETKGIVSKGDDTGTGPGPSISLNEKFSASHYCPT